MRIKSKSIRQASSREYWAGTEKVVYHTMDETLIQIGLPVKCIYADCQAKGFVKPKRIMMVGTKPSYIVEKKTLVLPRT